MSFGLVLAKIALPVVLAGGGVVAYVATPDTRATADSGIAIWIDSPLDGDYVPAGDVVVVAHTTNSTRVASMTLTVDGQNEATQSNLDEFDKLSNTSFTWKATIGTHILQVTAGPSASDPVTVIVGDPATGTPDPTSTTTTVESTTAIVETTTVPATTIETTIASTIAPATTIQPTTPPTAPPTTPPQPTTPPTTPPTPPPTPPPTTPPAPTLTNATVDPSFIPSSSCPNPPTITIAGTVTNTTGGQATVNSVVVAATVQGNQLIATITTAAAGIANKSGTFAVTLTANGPGGSVTVQAGNIFVLCGPKD